MCFLLEALRYAVVLHYGSTAALFGAIGVPNLAGTDEFMMAFQRVVTELAWGYAWSRPGLDRKTRSMLNIAILTALGRPDVLGIYVKGALATGVSVDEIKEILIHATVYCGTPAGRQAFEAAHEALLAEGALPGTG